MARAIGTRNCKWDKEELSRLYWEEGLSSNQMAIRLGLTGSAIRVAMIRLGIKTRTLPEALSGSRHYAWKGGRNKTSTGYIEIYQPDHHRANKRGYVYEHVMVWEKHNGRKLRKGEIVHHLNGIKTDNKPLNLLAMMKSTHDKLIPALRIRISQLEEELNRCSQMVMKL